mgnify:CR=1 FL=1
MAYRTASPSSTADVAKALSNVGIGAETGDKATIAFLSGLGDAPVELNAAEYDAAKGFFQQRIDKMSQKIWTKIKKYTQKHTKNMQIHIKIYKNV